MSEMMDFIVWFLGVLPEFLLTPPISAFTAFFFLFALGRIVHQMMYISLRR